MIRSTVQLHSISPNWFVKQKYVLVWEPSLFDFSGTYSLPGPNCVNTGCRVFKQEVQNQKDFCLRINIPRGNYWIFRIGLVGRCQKMSKFNFQSQFSMSKIIWISLSLFSLKNTNLGTHFLLLTFLIASIFKPLYY